MNLLHLLPLAHLLFSANAQPLDIPDSVLPIVDELEDTYINKDCLFTTRALLEHATFFAETIMFPNNSVQAEMINSTMFAEDVVGKIDVTRTYTGRELNTEYMYGLFVTIANQETANVFGYPSSYEMYEFAGHCDEYSMSLIVNASMPQINATSAFELNFWIKLNEDMEIVQYDASFKRWPLVFDYLLKMFTSALTETPQLNSTQTLTDYDYSVLANMMATSVCTVHQKYCTGANLQYDSYDDCLEFLTQDIRFGTSMEGGRNTLFCRMVHQNMVSLRPDVHCPHIGPSGGDMCLDDEATEIMNLLFDNNQIWADSFIGI